MSQSKRRETKTTRPPVRSEWTKADKAAVGAALQDLKFAIGGQPWGVGRKITTKPEPRR